MQSLPFHSRRPDKRFREKNYWRFRRLRFRLHKNIPALSIYLALFWLGLMIGLHSLIMMVMERLSLGEALWLSLTTITTVGYGDLSAKTVIGRFATVVLLYVGGVFVAARIAGVYFDLRNARSELIRMGYGDYKALNDHIVMIEHGKISVRSVLRLLREFSLHREIMARDVVMIYDGWEQGQPAALREKRLRHVYGHPTDPDTLARANVARAEIIVIRCYEGSEAISDSLTFDIVHRLRGANRRATIIAECVRDENRERLISAGASQVLRPTHSYPELIVAALLNPGSLEILENLFTLDGEHIVRVEGCHVCKWREIVLQFLERDDGVLPLAYRESGSGRIHLAPHAEARIDSTHLYLLARGDVV